MAAFSAWLFLNYSVSNAQLVESTTGNLITGTWAGAPSSITPVQGFAGGATPTFNTNTNTLQFGYTQRTASQAIAVNSALAAAGVGIQVTGFNYSWSYYNENMNRGTLSGNINLTNNTGSVIQNYNYSMPQTVSGWTVMQGTQTFPTQYVPQNLGNLTVSFTGKDDRFWAGYYGPLVKDIDVRLRYGVDPCVSNPASSPTCPGYSAIVTTNNLVPNPSASSQWGFPVNNSFAINNAFQQAGNGLKVHGFEYGFSASAADYCGLWIIICFDNREPTAQVNVSITNKTGTNIYSQQYNFRNQQGNYSYSHLFTNSMLLGNLGNFNMTASTTDNALVNNMYSRAIYTPDLCTKDPTSNPSCPGYFKATAGQSSTNSTSATNATSTTELPAIQVAGTTNSTQSSTVTEPQSTNSSTSNSSTPTTSSSTSTTITSSQTKVGEITTTNSQSNTKTTVSVSQILNIVNSEQNRISKLEMSTVTTAVAQAKQEAEKTINEAQAVAATQQAQTLSNNETLLSSVVVSPSSVFSQVITQTTNQIPLQSPITQSVLPSPAVTPTNQTNTQPQSLGSGIQISSIQSFNNIINPTFNSTSVETSNLSNVSSLNFSTDLSTISVSESQFKREDETYKNQSSETNNVSQTWNPTNPINTATNLPLNINAIPQGQIGPAVNRNVQSNQAAGGKDIDSIATSPTGFDAYSQLALRDGNFYRPYEVYRNQINVDNARALRQLSSDTLHQQMIEQQYKR